jgi:hypothetical protein
MNSSVSDHDAESHLAQPRDRCLGNCGNTVTEQLVSEIPVECRGAIFATYRLPAPSVRVVSGVVGQIGAPRWTRTTYLRGNWLWGTQTRQADDWPCPTSGSSHRHRSSTTGSHRTSRIHAAAGIGAREYSRRSPPSLSSHVTGPDVTTGSERAIGVRRSSPRWGRGWL